MASKLFFSIYVLYCFEVGLFLIVFPWMQFWEDNSVLFNYPVLRPILLNNFFRGGVTGLGFANVILGVWEIAHFKYYFRREEA